MSLKTALFSAVAAHWTGESALRKRRADAETARRRAGAPHLVEYFHQVDDPYSHLAAQALQLLADRYAIVLKPWIVGAPEDWAAPERALLHDYARRDAARLAARAELSYLDPGVQPAPDRIAAATAQISATRDAAAFLGTAVTVGEALWRGSAIRLPEGLAANGLDPAAAVAAGDARRKALGHFMGAMIHYGGEWYWGVDRLHFLEARLVELGLRRHGAPQSPVFAPPATPTGRAVQTRPGLVLHYYLSFRSPYTYIAASRAEALASAYGAELKLRFVLPMVMRGLPVPQMKSRYFTLDTAREARRVGVPFGRIADPVGTPVERGYSLLPWAIRQGRGLAYSLSFMRGVWSEGIDAGSDPGLRRIVERAGLSWSDARPRIGNDDWRAEAEANRREMIDLGLWGVPCFRVDDVSVWGQDRLWVIEDALIARTQP